MLRKPGSLAEFVLAIPSQVRRLPEGMAFEEAATLPVASLTALNGLRKGGNLSGKSVLVNGATGGVGHFAVQIAHAEGAKVTAICGYDFPARDSVRIRRWSGDHRRTSSINQNKRDSRLCKRLSL